MDSVREMLMAVFDDVIRHTDREEVATHGLGGNALRDTLDWTAPEKGGGVQRTKNLASKVLQHSVNTSSEGFLDKLYTAPLPPGMAAELILAALNTNVNVYSVSPALTVIEKQTAKALCRLFDLPSETSGGVTVPGGSAANQTSLLVARSALYPDTKLNGNGKHNFVLFTSADGHYSVDKAALMAGLGTSSVVKVPVDAIGRMIPAELEKAISKALDEGRTPFYVNCTAGTTVFGAFDPFVEISRICKKFGLWMHTDAAWGCSLAFSFKLKASRMQGIELSDSITFDAHKMLGVPILCSYLLVRDLHTMHQTNTLPASYLFHSKEDSTEVWDLADLTFQCGRRGDALKLALCWEYYGTAGFCKQIEETYAMAEYLTAKVKSSNFLTLVNSELDPPPCTQACFRATKHRPEASNNSQQTREIVQILQKEHQFMVDFASNDKGEFLRVVVNRKTTRATVDRLVAAIETILS